ncbi:MAG: peptigoglycan-binding protein LysM, partial [Pseudomonadales bacterium]|nr:peptigoglycan-binding protein LysM [Pseudomonadales bacterium]
MVLRKLAVALLSAGVLLPGLAHALAIGDIKTKSALNQPYFGEVLLTDVGDLGADEIRVDLATQDEFKQMGVERTTQLTDLHFAVIKKSDGTAIIRVTSEQPVTEPDLDFVLRVSWPGNTSMREFVALLDLPSGQVSATPVMQPAVTAPVVLSAAAPAETTSTEAAPAPVTSSASTPAPRSSKRQATSETSRPGHYRPRQGEGLWAIALKHRPSQQVTVQQTMMAIEK